MVNENELDPLYGVNNPLNEESTTPQMGEESNEILSGPSAFELQEEEEEKAYRNRIMDESLSYGVPILERTGLQQYLDELEKTQILPEAYYGDALVAGYSDEEIQEELQRRGQIQRERYRYQYEDNFNAAVEEKQKIVNEKARLDRARDFDASKYGLDAQGNVSITADDIEATDNDFLDTVSKLDRLDYWEELFKSGKYNQGDIRQYEQELSYLYGITLGREQALQESMDETALYDIPVLGDIARGIVEPIVRGEQAMGLGQQLTQEQVEAIQGYIPLLREREKEALGKLVDSQNNINARVGFRTNYNVENQDDIDNIVNDIYTRDLDTQAFSDAYTDLKEAGGIGVYGYVVQPLVNFAEEVAYGADDLLGGGAIYDGSLISEQWKAERKANNQAYKKVRDEGLISKRSMDRTWSSVFMDAMSGKEDWSELGWKTASFAHDLYADAFTSVFVLGKAAKSAKTVKGVKRIQNAQRAYLAALGFRGAGGYLDRIEEREDLTQAEKKLLATFVGASEALLANMFRAAETGIRGTFTKPSKTVVSEGLKRGGDIVGRLRQTRNQAMKAGYLSAGKAVLLESIEEAAQSLVEQNIANAFDISQGRKPQEQMSWGEFVDSAVGGALFGSLGARGAYRQQMAHHKIGAKRDSLKSLMRNLQTEIDSTTDSKRKAELQTKYLEAQDQLYSLNAIGRHFYSKLNDDQRSEVMGINNKLADLEDSIKESSGKEKANLIEEFKKLYARKTEIESSVISEAELAELNKDRPNVLDLKGLVTEVIANKVNESVKANHDNAESVDAEGIDVDSEAATQINEGLADYVRLRKEALKAKSPRTRNRLLNEATRAKDKAMKVANELGIAGMDFVELVENAEKGEFMSVDESATQAGKQAAKEKAAKEDAAKDDFSEFTLGETEGDLVEFSGVGANIKSNIVRAVNRLNKAFGGILKGTGAKIFLHNTEGSFYNASPSLRKAGAIELKSKDGAKTYGVMLFQNGRFEIHLNPNQEIDEGDVMEEFGHLALIPLLRNDAITRKRLFDAIQELAKTNRSAAKVLTDRERDYAGSEQAAFEEEIVLGFLVDYAMNPGAYKESSSKEKGLIRRIWDGIKNLFRTSIKKGEIDSNVFDFNDSLLDFAKKFRQASLGVESDINVRPGVSPELRIDDSERQSRRESRKRFTYLENTEVFYDHTLFSYDRTGSQNPYSTTRRSIKVKDYWHFSNLYAKLTGNGEEPGAMTGMYFMKDGKKHMVKPPKPRMNKDGTKKYYPVPDSVQGLAYKRRVKAAKAEEASRLELIKKKSELRKEIIESLKTIPGLPDGIDGISMSDFMPERVEGESESSLERMQVAKANIDALIESGFEFPLTADGREMRGSEARRRYSEQFNLTGMLTEAGKAAALEAQQEGDAPIVGGESISGLKAQPTEDGSRESRRLRRRSDIESNDVTLDKVSLDALQDAPWMMVSYDQVGGVTLKFENLRGTKDENIQIISGVQQIVNDFKEGNPSDSLSMSFSTLEKQREALNKISEIMSDKLYVFININGTQSAHYNEKLFRGEMLNWAAGQMKSRVNLVSMTERLDKAFSLNTSKKGAAVKTTYDVIKESEKFKALSAEQQAELGFSNGKFNLTSAKKAYALLDFYSSPEVSGFFDRKAVYDSVAPAGRGATMTKSQIEDAIVDENHTQDGLIMPPGTITTVMTIDIDSVQPRYVEGVPFPHQLTGLSNIQSLDKFMSTRGLFGRTPTEVSRNMALSEPVTSEQAIIQEAEVYGREAAKKEIKDKIESLVNYYKISEATDFSAVNRLSQMWEELSEWAVESSSRLEEAMPKGKIIERADFDANVSYPAIRAYLASMNFEIGDAIGEAMYDVLSGISEQNLSDGELDAFLAANIDGLMQTGNERGFTPLGGALVYGAYNAISSIKKKRGGEALDMMDAREFVETHIMHSRRQPRNNTMSNPQSWTLGEKSNMQRMIESFQKKLVDKYQGILNLQAEVEKQRGRQADKGADFKMAEELMYGKAANDLELLDGKVAKLTEFMGELGVTEENLSNYLYALHVKERNALIKERSGVEDGSGKSDAWADQTLKELEGQTQNLEKAAKMVRDIQDNTRKTYVRLGLHTQEDIDTWTNMFEHYVPLSGLATDEENEISSPYPTGGKGLSVTSSMVKKAKGRKSAAENIVAQVIAQNAAAHIKGRTNEAILALHNLVKENPNENVWKIINVADRDNPNVVGVRVDGKQKYIFFKDASYAETLRGMNMPQTNLVISLLRKPAGWLRSSFTTLNPEFMVSNFSRDIQSAIFNAAAEAEIEGGVLNGESVISDIMKNVGPSLKSLLKGAIGKDMKPEYAAYFEDFKADGGKTGWAFAKDLATIAKELQPKGEKTRAQELLGKAKNFAKTVEGINDAFENSIRLSAYIAARENGISRDKAAQFAKNITVNFNKHGEYGQTLNAVYLFFNASVQGTSRLFRSLLTMKPAVRPDGSKAEWYNRFNGAQKMAAGLALFNAMLTMLNQAMSDDDEDEISFYDKIPDYVKERNLIFMYDGKNYITIPMPYGFNVFANVGSASVEVASGSKPVDEAMMFLANSFVSSFSPISFGQSEDIGKYTVKAVSPTILKPLVEYGVNETYFGSPVYAEQFPFGAPKPDSEMSFRSPDSVQSMFRWLNEVTGGSQYRSGAVDINPDPYWYIFQYFVGGAGQFVTRTGETTYKIARKLTDTPELKLEYNDMPMLRKMYGAPSKYYDFQLYDERKKEIQTLRKEMRDPKTRRAISEYKGVEYLYKLSSKYDKQLREIRKQKRDAKRIADFPTRTVKVQELMDKERKIVMEYNRLYNNYRGNE